MKTVGDFFLIVAAVSTANLITLYFVKSYAEKYYKDVIRKDLEEMAKSKSAPLKKMFTEYAEML